MKWYVWSEITLLWTAIIILITLLRSTSFKINLRMRWRGDVMFFRLLGKGSWRSKLSLISVSLLIQLSFLSLSLLWLTVVWLTSNLLIATLNNKRVKITTLGCMNYWKDMCGTFISWQFVRSFWKQQAKLFLLALQWKTMQKSSKRKWHPKLRMSLQITCLTSNGFFLYAWQSPISV